MEHGQFLSGPERHNSRGSQLPVELGQGQSAIAVRAVRTHGTKVCVIGGGGSVAPKGTGMASWSQNEGVAC